MNVIRMDSLSNVAIKRGESSMDGIPESAAETDDESADEDTIFQMPDLTLKIGKRKLYVTSDDFKQISKVFEAMLTNDFKEKNSGEIEFKDIDYKTFVRFLRVSHPGLKDPFEDKWVHDVLPLIDEFLAEDTRHEADEYLAKTTIRNKDLSSSDLIENLIEAEQYKLPKYLRVCINRASKKLINDFLSDKGFNKVSLETRYKISIQKWKASDMLAYPLQNIRGPVEQYY